MSSGTGWHGFMIVPMSSTRCWGVEAREPGNTPITRGRLEFDERCFPEPPRRGAPMRVSVITPSYNSGAFISDALLSVARQKVVPNHIVADGGSEDDTLAILERHGGSHLRWLSEPDTGQSQALNRGLALATGDWIGWLNADEFYLPWALCAVESAAQQRPDADVFFGDFLHVDARGALLKLNQVDRVPHRGLRWAGCVIASCTVFVRADLLREVGWDESKHLAMDWELYLRLLNVGAVFAHTGTVMSAYRLHEAQMSVQPHVLAAGELDQIAAAHGLPAGFLRRAAGAAYRVARQTRRFRLMLAEPLTRQAAAWARDCSGADMRWFDNDAACRNVHRLPVHTSHDVRE